MLYSFSVEIPFWQYFHIMVSLYLVSHYFYIMDLNSQMTERHLLEGYKCHVIKHTGIDRWMQNKIDNIEIVTISKGPPLTIDIGMKRISKNLFWPWPITSLINIPVGQERLIQSITPYKEAFLFNQSKILRMRNCIRLNLIIKDPLHWLGVRSQHAINQKALFK